MPLAWLKRRQTPLSNNKIPNVTKNVISSFESGTWISDFKSVFFVYLRSLNPFQLSFDYD